MGLWVVSGRNAKEEPQTREAHKHQRTYQRHCDPVLPPGDTRARPLLNLQGRLLRGHERLARALLLSERSSNDCGKQASGFFVYSGRGRLFGCISGERRFWIWHAFSCLGREGSGNRSIRERGKRCLLLWRRRHLGNCRSHQWWWSTQVCEKSQHIRIAFLRSFGQSFENSFVNMLRALWLEPSGRGGLLRGMQPGQQSKVVRLKRWLAGQEFIGQAGQRVLIAQGRGHATKLLRGHIERGKRGEQSRSSL